MAHSGGKRLGSGAIVAVGLILLSTIAVAETPGGSAPQGSAPAAAPAAHGPDAFDRANTFAVSLTAAIGAINTLIAFPQTFIGGLTAIREMWNYGANHQRYLEAEARLAEYTKNKDKSLLELGEHFKYYLVSLERLDRTIRGALGAEPLSYETLEGLVTQDLSELAKAPGNNFDLPGLAHAEDEWQKRKNSRAIDQWLDSELSNPYFTTAAGRGWLRKFVDHRKQLAAQQWVEKQSTRMLDALKESKFVHFLDSQAGQTERDTTGLKPALRGWWADYERDKEEEYQSARDFIAEFDAFTNAMNAALEKKGTEYDSIETTAGRAPGRFITGKDRISKSAAQTMALAQMRCDEGYAYFAGLRDQAAAIGTVRGLPIQIGRAGLTIATAGGGVFGAGVAITSFLRLIRQQEEALGKKAPAKPATASP